MLPLTRRDPIARFLPTSITVTVLLSTMWALSGSAAGCYAQQQPHDFMREKTDQQLLSALGSTDGREASDAAQELVRRGARMIPELLKLKGATRVFSGSGLGHPRADQLIYLPSGIDQQDKGRVVTLEVAALYLISAIYYGDLSFAQSPYLTDLQSPAEKRRTTNAARLVSKAWTSTTAWSIKVKDMGLESLRSANQGPLSGSGVAFW
jgi:hypothetical protein